MDIFYRRQVGIPQGCTISPILCAIYYAYLDREFSNSNCFISRYVDDFLIISDDFSEIQKFFKIAGRLSTRGFKINYSKVTSNVDLTEIKEQSLRPNHFDFGEIVTESFSDHKVIDFELLDRTRVRFISDHIDWCGIKIFDWGVSIKSNCIGKDFSYSVSVNQYKRGHYVFANLKKVFRIKFSSIFINFNNKKLGENFFDGLFFVARKLKILMSRLSFVNHLFVKNILKYFEDELYAITIQRNIRFDKLKLKSIAQKAFEKSGINQLRQKSIKK